MIRVKICGITRESDLIAAAEAGADAIGLVAGFPNSPRNLPPERIRELMKIAPPFLDVVLVLNGEDERFAMKICEELRPDAVQLYGDASPEDIKALGVRWVIKPIKPGEKLDIGLKGFDAILIDGSMGSGKAWNWVKCLEIKEKATLPTIIAGGLNPDNVREVIEVVKPYGVDVSSGVERSPGIKDPDLINLFVRRAKEVAP
ncbi:MAG: phosphoribosylanthranilate isomerase [Aigarchaeota archaeon]|nr:phosphoribosylanthranilate isomerase [Aigarchaeota archaeon]